MGLEYLGVELEYLGVGLEYLGVVRVPRVWLEYLGVELEYLGVGVPLDTLPHSVGCDWAGAVPEPYGS